jgi:hypothetical protein
MVTTHTKCLSFSEAVPLLIIALSSAKRRLPSSKYKGSSIGPSRSGYRYSMMGWL